MAARMSATASVFLDRCSVGVSFMWSLQEQEEEGTISILLSGKQTKLNTAQILNSNVRIGICKTSSLSLPLQATERDEREEGCTQRRGRQEGVSFFSCLSCTRPRYLSVAKLLLKFSWNIVPQGCSVSKAQSVCIPQQVQGVCVLVTWCRIVGLITLITTAQSLM